MANWVVRGTYTVADVTIEDLEDLALDVGGGTVYDHASGHLTLSYVLSAPDVWQAADYALKNARRLSPVNSLELRRA